MNSFQQKVLEVVKGIPQGNVMTYGEVAKASGSPHASRAVGTIMAKNEDKEVPCHRVIKSDGSVGVYNGLRGTSKQSILEKEGVVFSEKGKVLL